MAGRDRRQRRGPSGRGRASPAVRSRTQRTGKESSRKVFAKPGLRRASRNRRGVDGRSRSDRIPRRNGSANRRSGARLSAEGSSSGGRARGDAEAVSVFPAVARFRRSKSLFPWAAFPPRPSKSHGSPAKRSRAACLLRTCSPVSRPPFRPRSFHQSPCFVRQRLHAPDDIAAIKGRRERNGTAPGAYNPSKRKALLPRLLDFFSKRARLWVARLAQKREPCLGGTPAPIESLDAARRGYPNQGFGIRRAERNRPAIRLPLSGRGPVRHFTDPPVPSFDGLRTRGNPARRPEKALPGPARRDRYHDARRSHRLRPDRSAAAFAGRRRAHRHVNRFAGSNWEAAGQRQELRAGGNSPPSARSFGRLHDLEGRIVAAYGALLFAAGRVRHGQYVVQTGTSGDCAAPFRQAAKEEAFAPLHLACPPVSRLRGTPRRNGSIFAFASRRGLSRRNDSPAAELSRSGRGRVRNDGVSGNSGRRTSCCSEPGIRL